MKKLLIAVLSAIAVFGAVLGFSACGNDTKLPTTAYEKVVFAFNGVEKSFTSAAKKSSYKTASAEGLSSSDFESALNVIRGVYTSGDNQGDVIDELEYDQPPMIQFQCLKKVMEKTGANFSLGTKYYCDVHGEMYMDAETGFQVESTAADAQDHKYSYVFDFALAIDIDENDLITAEVSFNIHLERTDESYDTVWFVRLELDYDMTDATPNYSLAMFTENDETDLPFYNADTYEYDFVNVKDNVINEWRKFCYSTDRKVVKDETHTAFSDYIAEDITYKADTCKWYENKALRKITQQTAEKQQTVAGAFFGGIGLNSTDINAKPFLDRQGTKTEIIKNLYSEMSSIFRKDLVYNLVCKDDHGNNGGNGNQGGDNGNGNVGPTYSRIGIFIDGALVGEIPVVTDTSGERFLKSLDICYVGATQERLEPITDFSSAQFKFYSLNGLETPNISLSFRDFITSSMENILSFCNYDGIMEIVLGNAVGAVHIYYGDNQGNNQGNDQGNEDGSAAILAEMEAQGYLPFETVKGQLSAIKREDVYYVTVIGTNVDECGAYKRTLATAGYVQIDVEEFCAITKSNSIIYVNLGKMSGSEIDFSVRFEQSNRFAEWPAQSITEWLDGFEGFPQPTDSAVLYEREGYGPETMTVYGLSIAVRQNYLVNLATLGTLKYSNDGRQAFLSFIHNGMLYTIEIDIEDYKVVFDFGKYAPQTVYDYSITVNSETTTAMTLTIIDANRIEYSATLTLNENDVVTFSEDNVILSHVKLNSDGLYTVGNDYEFTVKNAGTYLFRVEKADPQSPMIKAEKVNQNGSQGESGNEQGNGNVDDESASQGSQGGVQTGADGVVGNNGRQ